MWLSLKPLENAATKNSPFSFSYIVDRADNTCCVVIRIASNLESAIQQKWTYNRTLGDATRYIWVAAASMIDSGSLLKIC